MLNHLHIRNLAVIDEVEVELGPGKTVLTGETGAGKSILLDALGMSLGARSEARLLRAGADPNTTAFSGHTPLHVAAIRGFDDVAALLVEHGADPERRSHDG